MCISILSPEKYLKLDVHNRRQSISPGMISNQSFSGNPEAVKEYTSEELLPSL